jgi:hypothetical protein
MAGKKSIKVVLHADPAEGRTADLFRTPGYIHQPLKNARNQLRLLQIWQDDDDRICGSVETSALFVAERTMPYRALSYAWGQDTARHHVYLRNHTDAEAKPFLVTDNLYQVLQHITERQGDTSPHPRWHGWWWIDAMCIIQDESDAEKGIQINNMKSIYERAEEVFAWIGPGNQSSERAMNYIKTLDENFDPVAFENDATVILDYTVKSFRQYRRYLNELLAKPYWSRLWIMQELAVSRRVTTIACGGSELPWDTFVNFATRAALLDDVCSTTSRRQYVWLLTQIYQNEPKSLSIGKLIYLAKDSQCGEATDTIRALLGLVGTGEGLKIIFDEHTSAYTIISHAIRAMIVDLENEATSNRISGGREHKSNLKSQLAQCRAIAKKAHHQPIEMRKDKHAKKKRYGTVEDLLADCRRIATVCYGDRVLYHYNRDDGSTLEFYLDKVVRTRMKDGRSETGCMTP